MEAYFFQTEKLSVGYDGKPLIKEIEIKLNRGQILTLIGPDGAGKSLQDSLKQSGELFILSRRKCRKCRIRLSPKSFPLL